MAINAPERQRLAHTPLLDKQLKQLARALDIDGAQQDLIHFMNKMNRKTERHWGNQLSAIIHRRRLPNAEVLLVIQKWLNLRK